MKLEPGDSAEVDIPVSRDQLRWWNTQVSDWVAATGDVQFEIRGTFGTTAAAATLPATDSET